MRTDILSMRIACVRIACMRSSIMRAYSSHTVTVRDIIYYKNPATQHACNTHTLRMNKIKIKICFKSAAFQLQISCKSAANQLQIQLQISCNSAAIKIMRSTRYPCVLHVCVSHSCTHTVRMQYGRGMLYIITIQQPSTHAIRTHYA